MLNGIALGLTLWKLLSSFFKNRDFRTASFISEHILSGMEGFILCRKHINKKWIVRMPECVAAITQCNHYYHLFPLWFFHHYAIKFLSNEMFDFLKSILKFNVTVLTKCPTPFTSKWIIRSAIIHNFHDYISWIKNYSYFWLLLTQYINDIVVLISLHIVQTLPYYCSFMRLFSFSVFILLQKLI